MKHNVSKIVYPKEFQSGFIVCIHPLFFESFAKILEGSGRKIHVMKQFDQRLKYLETNRHMAFLRPKWIEKLGHNKGIYSLRIIDKDLNIRIPFIFYTYKNKEYVVLTSVFLEKKKAQAKSYSYDSEIESIRPIIDGIEEVFNNGIQTD